MTLTDFRNLTDNMPGSTEVRVQVMDTDTQQLRECLELEGDDLTWHVNDMLLTVRGVTCG